MKVREVDETHDLAEVSALLESVWGRNPEGVPLPSEVLRSLAHAGGCTLAAYDRSGRLVGAACLTPARPSTSVYGLIAAVAPGQHDRGIGRLLKSAQRAWALERGFTTMTWTFDPLVARNARFNLVTLGALAREYVVSFYGPMTDELNGGDVGDRLVASWELASPRAERAVTGVLSAEPVRDRDAEASSVGPDGAPMALRDQTGLWVRVPDDVVELRRRDPGLAAAWRHAVREVMAPELSEGGVLHHVTRDGWYLASRGALR